MINATGSTQREASAILKLKKKRLIAMITVEISEPANGGMKCENAVSR